MKQSIIIHWFRQDLRLSDNPAFSLATKQALTSSQESTKKQKYLMPIYILDDINAGDYAMGNASRWWLYYSLISLRKALDNTLSIYHKDPTAVFDDVATRFDVCAVYWNRCYEPWRMIRDANIKEHLTKKGIDVQSYNGSLLWEPWTIKKDDGTPYRVFTPFYRKACLNAQAPREPLPTPRHAPYLNDKVGSIELAQLGLLPTIRWDKQLEPHWHIGEEGAHIRFQQFIDEGLGKYKEGRNFPAKPWVSRLSPHLRFGEISPNQLWYVVNGLADNEHGDHFSSELGWREFSYNLLYHNHDLPKKNLQSKFDRFPWSDDVHLLSAWQKGQTGIPMVDAGMRELWQTGYMHGRARMIAGSFLVKNLGLHWHHGERWFWDTLVDADLANNSASWQWIAGCGADAAPYFRIFNPVMQGHKFDAEGSYVRKFIPEIASLPNKYLFCPWEAPDHVLHDTNIVLGSSYPLPIVDLKQSRNAALLAFQSLKQ